MGRKGDPMDEILSRISVRDYLPDPVDPSKIDAMLRAAMQAPSAQNQQCWEFIVVDDRGLLDSLSDVSPYSKMIAGAPLAFIVLGNTERMKVPHMWEQDLGACVQNLMLEGVTQGVGTVWIGIAPVQERMDSICRLFDLPDNLRPFCLISAGYPKETPVPKPSRYDPSRIHHNSYQG